MRSAHCTELDAEHHKMMVRVLQRVCGFTSRNGYISQIVYLSCESFTVMEAEIESHLGKPLADHYKLLDLDEFPEYTFWKKPRGLVAMRGTHAKMSPRHSQ